MAILKGRQPQFGSILMNFGKLPEKGGEGGREGGDVKC